MLSRTVLKHHYKDCGSYQAPNLQDTIPSWERLGFTKKYWKSLTKAQRTELTIQYYDRLDGGES
jgi:hypothetical protein